MVLKTAYSIWWYFKLLSTHRARCVIAGALVLEIAFKTFEAEGVKTRQ